MTTPSIATASFTSARPASAVYSPIGEVKTNFSVS